MPAVPAAADRADPPPKPVPGGDPDPADLAAFNRLFSAIERSLRGLAHDLLERNRRVDDVDTTVLVHDMYVKLSRSAIAEWTSEESLLSAASKILRRLLIDAVRARDSRKRGEQDTTIDLDSLVERYEGRGPYGTAQTDLIDLEEAVKALEGQAPRVAKMLELNYYLGIHPEEIARVFGVSVRTVFRRLEDAKTFLKGYMDGSDGPPLASPGNGPSDVPK